MAALRRGLVVAVVFVSACHGCERRADVSHASLGGHDAWVARLDDTSTVPSVTPAGDLVVAGGGFNSYSLFALDAKTGKTVWSSNVGDNGAGPVVAFGDSLAFTTESCTLEVADARTGKIRWSNYLADPLVSHPAARDDVVYVVAPSPQATHTHALFAFAAADGRELWRVPMDADAIGAPTVGADRIYVSTEDGLLRRFTREGKETWTVAAGAMSEPVVGGDDVFVVAREGSREGLRRVRDGAAGPTSSELWHPHAVASVAREPLEVSASPAARRHLGTNDIQKLWSWQGGHPVLAEGRVYALLGDELVAFDARSGQETWSTRVSDHPSPPAVSANAVFVVAGGALEVHDATTGALGEKIPLEATATFPPVVVGDRVVVSTDDGRVMSIGRREATR